MNKDNAKDYLPLVQALAEGKTIQCLDVGNNWTDIEKPLFDTDARYYRIKPEPVKGWYRVALMGSAEGRYTYTADETTPVNYVEGGSEFVRWLTDRIEYEV